jgi:hypothetical protein
LVSVQERLPPERHGEFAQDLIYLLQSVLLINERDVMATKRLLTPGTREEMEHEFLNYDMGALHCIVDAATGEILKWTRTEREAVEFIWKHNGADFKVAPRIAALYDEFGQKTNLTRQQSNQFGLEWDVYFKSSDTAPWILSRLSCYGASERIARADLLIEAARREVWLTSDYFVVPFYKKEMFESLKRIYATYKNGVCNTAIVGLA